MEYFKDMEYFNCNAAGVAIRIDSDELLYRVSEGRLMSIVEADWIYPIKGITGIEHRHWTSLTWILRKAKKDHFVSGISTSSGIALKSVTVE